MSEFTPRVKKQCDTGDLTQAPDSAVIGELNQRYGKLNEVWAEAEADLKQFPIPHMVMQRCASSEVCDHYLAFVKVKGAWRICWGELWQSDPEQDYGWCPIAECALDVRLRAVEHYGNLRNAVREAAEATVMEVDKAISKLTLELL